MVLCALVPPVSHLVIRRQLQILVAEKLGADLTIGSIEYEYPFGLILGDTVIANHNQNGQETERITIPRLAVTLAHSPRDNGPLVVERLMISDPQIHIIRAGSAGAEGGSPWSGASLAMPANLSSVIQIRELSLRGGQVVYDDQRVAGAGPMVLNQLNVNLHGSGDAPAQYTYEFACDDGRRAYLRCTGSADVDDLLVKVASCWLSLGIDSAGPDSTLPAELQAWLRPWQARGIVQIDIAGTLPLRRPLDGVYHSTIKLRDASGTVPGLQMPVDSLAFALDCSDATATGVHPQVKVESFDASAGDMRVSLADAVATADLHAKTWQLSVKQVHVTTGQSPAALPGKLRASLERLRVTGAADFAINASGPLSAHAVAGCAGQLVVRPHDLTLQPEGFDRPIDGFGDATITLANGELQVESLRATYADNLLYLKTARVRAVDLPNLLRADEIAGSLTLGPAGIYPAPLALDFFSDTHPVGPFFFDGAISVDSTRPQPAMDYQFNVHTTRGRLTLGPSRIPLSDIDGTVSITPAGLIMSAARASLLDGTVTGSGEMHFTSGFPYELRTDCRDIELERLAEDLAGPGEQPIRLSGRGALSSHLHGTIPSDDSPAYNALAGEGEFEIRRGDFWEIPILKSIAGAFSKDALTFGAAAGRFHIGGGKTHFDRIVVSSPLLGVEGSGDVAFAGALDLNGVADPFGSWGDRIPIAPLSLFAGALQRTVNIATSQVLWDIHVSGTTSNPKTTEVLAPLVTHGVQSLLSLTHTPNRTGDMLREMHKQTDPPETGQPK